MVLFLDFKTFFHFLTTIFRENFDQFPCDLPRNRQICEMLSRLLTKRYKNSTVFIFPIFSRSENFGDEVLERSVRTPETDIIGSLRLQALRERLARERAMMRNFGSLDFDFWRILKRLMRQIWLIFFVFNTCPILICSNKRETVHAVPSNNCYLFFLRINVLLIA